jgi:hypothetical protein
MGGLGSYEWVVILVGGNYFSSRHSRSTDGLVDNESLWVTLQLGGIELANCGVYMSANSGK